MLSKSQDHKSGRYQAALSHHFNLLQWKVLPELNRFQNDRSGQQISIEPRLMQLLCLLAANEGQVVDRETLVEALWPRVVVNENSLTRAVSELRKHLRQIAGSSSTVIETIPKRGYRLLIPQTESAQREAWRLLPAAGLSALIMGKLKAQTALGGALVLSAIIVSALPSLWSAASRPNLAPSISYMDELVPSEPNIIGGSVTLSNAETSATSAATVSRPIVSHDGQAYAYFQYDQQGSTLFFGNTRESADPVAIYQSQHALVNLSWSPLGDSLLFALKPEITTAALFPSANKLQLLTLDLTNREVKRLVEDEIEPAAEPVTDQNMT